MSLTFEQVTMTSRGAAALALPSIVALLAYLSAAFFGGSTARLAAAGQASVDTGRSTTGVATGLRAAVVVAWLAHAVAIAIDASGFGTVAGTSQASARFGFAPALSVTVWLVVAVYLAESHFLPLAGVRRVLAVLGASAVVLAWLFPGDLRPQLASRWIPLHWIMGIASYGLFGAAVLHAALLNRADRMMRGNPRGSGPRAGGPTPAPLGLPLLRLERLTFQFVGAGFIVLTIAIVLGWYFADPWRWDHKAVFSILGWAVFAALLAGRRAFGWRGRHATRWLYTGTGLLLLAYVGSRFVLEVVLHRPPLGP